MNLKICFLSIINSQRYLDISENYREHLNKVHDKIKSWNKEDLEIMRKICNLPKAI